MQDEIQQLIAADLGIAHLSSEEQQAIITQFGVVALKAATTAVVGKMTPEKRDEFTKLAQAGDPAALQAFLTATVPDHEQLAKAAVAEELKRLKEFQAAGSV
jgi:hypothetical protein